MAKHLFIVPGYSDEDFSFIPLKNLLVNQQLYEEENIYSIEYASLNDQADFRDFADRLDDIYNEMLHKNEIDPRIDVLAHSTGSLVVRAWLYLRRMRQRVRKEDLDVPVEHLFLFAPANFGSDLAKIGQSSLNALRVTFTKLLSRDKTLVGNQGAFETGRKVLQGLEPASPIQWELSNADLHKETYFGEYDDSKRKDICFPFVFAAGRYFDKLESILVDQLRKEGTDSTVRIAGTSLNTRKCILRARNVLLSNVNDVEWDDELIKDKFIDGKLILVEGIKRKKFADIAFAIFGEYDHCGIINGKGIAQDDNTITFSDGWKPLALLQKAKSVATADDYKKVAQEFRQKTDAYKSSRDSVFQQFFFTTIDDTGVKVEDYFIKFCAYDLNVSTDEPNKALTDKLRESFGDATNFHVHSVDPSNRALMIDTKKAQAFIRLLGDNKKITLEVTAKSPYNGVSYSKVRNGVSLPIKFVVYDSENSNKDFPNFFFPYTTTLVQIVLDRIVDRILLDRGDFTSGSAGSGSAGSGS